MPGKGHAYSNMWSLLGARWLAGHPRRPQEFISIGGLCSGEGNPG